jgi:hypothetical protein
VSRDEVTTLGDQVYNNLGRVEPMRIGKFDDKVDTGHIPGMLGDWEW